MRKQIFFLLSICLVVISCSNPKEKGFTLNGKLTNAEDGIIIELVPGACHNNNIRAIVSDTVKSGIFRLKVDADEPRLYSIRKQGTYGGYNIVLANDEVVFEAVYSESKNDQNSWCYFDEVSVTGAPLHEEYPEIITCRNAPVHLYENNRGRV